MYGHGSINKYPRVPVSSVVRDPPLVNNPQTPVTFRSGKPADQTPLVLTDYIEAKQAEKAKTLSQVILPGLNITSYAGYLRVNATPDRQFNASLFFWFFPAEVNAASAPVLVWLQGGPGASSMFGVFQEHGPFFLSKNNGYVSLEKRKTHWTHNHNVIYIDNPVGTGFSYAQHPDLYSRNEVQIGNNLYVALKQFFKVFPEYQKNDFYVTGESYAGKYVPALAYTIHVKNPIAKDKINLKGIAIGSGMCDPVNMMMYSSYLYQIGLVDDNGKKMIQHKEKEAVRLIQEEKWGAAYDVFDTILEGDFNESMSFKNLTGFSNYFNYFVPTLDISPHNLMQELFMNATFKKCIHVGNTDFKYDDIVGNFLKEDIMKSVKSWIELLVNATETESNIKKYKFLFYGGQLDLIVAYPLTVNFLKALNWSGKDEYSKVARKIWYFKNDIAGYVKKLDNLYEVLVRNAGHFVPSDQPEWAFDLITRFTSGKL
ncbi:hypothetical protein WDU94_000497 [Cyamophila willieti]